MQCNRATAYLCGSRSRDLSSGFERAGRFCAAPHGDREHGVEPLTRPICPKYTEEGKEEECSAEARKKRRDLENSRVLGDFKEILGTVFGAPLRRGQP